MPVPTSLSDLSVTPASNSPASTDTLSTTDDHLRAQASIIKRIAVGTDALTSPALGTPASGTLTNCTGLPVSTGISGLGTSVATFLATPSSANLAAALTDETGSGANVFATSPTLVTPILGTPTSGTLTNCTGLPVSSGISGLGTGVATALAVNVGTAGAPVVNGGALGTPSSGTVTNLTGTASININGTVGATTPAAGTFTSLTNTNSSIVNSTANAGLELGAKASANTPFVDFNSSGNSNDYDARILASGGTTIGTGSLSITASTTTFSNNIAVNGNATLGDAEATDTHSIKGATTILSNSASAALTVTNTGSGNSFVVEDSASTDSTPFVIDASGKVIIGNTTSTQSASLQQYGSTGGVAAAYFERYAADSNAFIIYLSKTRGTSAGAKDIVASGDTLGGLYFQGTDGVAGINSATITAQVDGTPGTNDMPGRLVFSTTADGASSPTERMRIDSTGKITASASYVAHSATAIPAGGTAGAGLMVSSTDNFGVFFGSGAPTLSAAKGSLYLRSDGSTTNDRMYVNTNGTTTWTAVITAA